ncbi:MAG: hypothetical protein G01um101493_141 [Microgenomates group bacterium Gr01-1014_93]|nr:MAG: hypothetical protein G01um101493_141 [Microgenomates group bacterium Gr01-1014_93]
MDNNSLLFIKKFLYKFQYIISNFFFKTLFPFWQTLGFHLVRNHFYEPIPDTRTLKYDLWTNYSKLIGLSMNIKKQVSLLSTFSKRFKHEYEHFPVEQTQVPYEYYINNVGFESVDGEILYCMIRNFKPKKFFEIGSGNSTFLAAKAALQNKKDGYPVELIAIDPYPNKIIKSGFPGFSKVIISKIEDVPVAKFGELKKNDILFIDSSHVLRIGGDVWYEYCEILPRLKKGVMVHVHDIFLPAEYPKRHVLKGYYFWNEQYLLQTFLAFNRSFEILFGGSYMHLNHSAKLKAAFSSYDPKKRGGPGPSSFWLRRIA